MVSEREGGGGDVQLLPGSTNVEGFAFFSDFLSFFAANTMKSLSDLIVATYSF